jgi:ATP-binding cassette subfamily F protein uup
VGGYDDWQEQASREHREPVGAGTDTPVAAKGKPVKERPRKLSFKEERELETLPEQIMALEEEQAELHRQLADPEFYKRVGAGIAEINGRLQQLEQDVAAYYQRWQELDALKISLSEGANR